MSAVPVPHHDSAAFLEAVFLEEGDGLGRGNCGGTGWYVRRTCACHHHLIVSIRFGTEAEARRLVRVLDEDSRRRKAG